MLLIYVGLFPSSQPNQPILNSL